MRMLGCFLIAIAILHPGASFGADFSSSKKFWLDNVFVCKSNSVDFPSKEGDKPGSCDDGDMTLFNGLLCLSGQDIGCTAVQKSQGPDGRWWRSPRRINWEAPNHDVSFSPDQALGVFAYLIATRDL